MKERIFCGIFLFFLIFSFMIVGWNFESIADPSKSCTKSATSNISDQISKRSIDWSHIEVISEPILSKNINKGWSFGCQIEAENDNLYVVWVDDNNTNAAGVDNDVFYRYFDGTSWGETQVISEPVPGLNHDTGDTTFLRLAVDNGKIFVIWSSDNSTDGSGTDNDIFFRCNLTGSGWEDIQVISEPVQGNDFNTGISWMPDIAVENGKIFVTWVDTNNTNGAGSDFDILFRCNLTGSSWENIQVISEPVAGQDFNTQTSFVSRIAVENDKIYVTWEDQNNTDGAGTDKDIFYRTNLTANSWDKIQVLSEPIFGQGINTGLSEYPEIAVENDIVYLIWSDENNSNGAGTDMDIFYLCNLTGSNWEPLQVISEPVFGQNFNSGYSVAWGLAVQNGNIHIAWADDNNTNGAGTDSDIHYRAKITGDPWSKIEVASEPVAGQDNNIAVSGGEFISVDNNRAYFIWADTNNTTNSGDDRDIFFRYKQISFPSLYFSLPKVSPKLGNTSTEFNFSIIYNQLNNTAPTMMKVIIDGTEHSMIEIDPLDTNYTNGKKYYFTMKNLDIGTHTYEFNASDGTNFTNSRLFSNLIVINTPSKMLAENNLTAIEDQYYEVIYEYEDIDIDNAGQICHWEFNTNASWLNFDLVSGILSGTPYNNDVGEFWVYIAVNDTIEIVSTNFTLKVLDINDRPIITTNNVDTANEDELYEVDYNATDVDSQINKQKWSLKTNASLWLNLSSLDGIINGTPGNDDVGQYWVNITVNDTEGGFDFTNFTLTILNVNDDPIIITEVTLLTGTDKLYEVQYNATDIDSSSSNFIWSLKTNATWLSIDPNTGFLSGTPTSNDAGWYTVNVTISDSDGGYDWHEFILTVYKSNLPPMITTTDIVTIMVNKTYYVDYNATDDRSIELLEWSLNTNATWLSIDSSTGVLSGFPTIEKSGKTYWINVTVIDTMADLDYHNFTLRVLKEPIIVIENRIPQLLNFKLSPNEGDTDTEFTFSVKYVDPDDDSPDSIQIVIDGIAFDLKLRTDNLPYHGIYEYTTRLSIGEHSYYFTTSDGSDTNTSETYITPTIIAPKKVNGDDGSESEGFAWEMLILVIVIIIIIVLILVYLMVRKRKEEPESIPPPEPVSQESLTEPEPISDTAPTSPLYTDYQTEEPMVQEDLYYSPPAEESEQQIEMIYQQEADQEFSEFEE
jgi:hypothetical protein